MPMVTRFRKTKLISGFIIFLLCMAGTIYFSFIADKHVNWYAGILTVALGLTAAAVITVVLHSLLDVSRVT